VAVMDADFVPFSDCQVPKKALLRKPIEDVMVVV
jgi:hypothetical protein